MGANLALARWKKNLAAAVVQLDGSVLTWHMIEWFSTACCLYAARSKNENRAYGAVMRLKSQVSRTRTG
jgi:hypothetical protein